jgi:apolipoprotein N-acyltransferase
MRMTDSLVMHSTPKPDLVLWPETAMPYYILVPKNRAMLEFVRSRIEELGVPVLFGLPHAVYYDDTTKAPPSAKRIEVTGERYDAFNSTAFIQPGVEEIPWYGKMKMVPVAERVPYADAFYFLDFLRWGVGIGGWQIGRDTVIFQERKTGAKFCSLICYESVYPEFVAEFVKRGAEFIAIVTIDSWWDRMSGAYQHHQYAIFRAVENRRWVARCAVGGFSSYIDPYGRVYDKTELFAQAALSRTILRIDKRMANTFYTRHGDWVGRWCAVVAGGWVLVAIVSSVKRKMNSSRR